MGLLSWIVLGLGVGALVKKFMTRPVTGGWFAVLALGVSGAALGGILGRVIFRTGFGGLLNLRTWVLSVIGAMGVAWAHGVLDRRRLDR